MQTDETDKLDRPRASDLIQIPGNRAVILKNATCAYCGRLFTLDLRPTKEHVIGRKFVPRGFLSGQWNLILQACEDCNCNKSDLEDDISAISLSLNQTGTSTDVHRLEAEITRKGRSRSRRTGRPVADSRESLELKGALGSASFSFKFTAPPQIECRRLYQLAHYHFRGFFYYITYRRDVDRGGFVPGGFFPLGAAQLTDWGAPRQRWFMETVRNWDVRVHAIGAKTYFKLLIRRLPGEAVWSWAVEWNRAIRVVGFAGDRSACEALLSKAPEECRRLVQESGAERIWVRMEETLSEHDDELFTVVLNRSGSPDFEEGQR